MSDTPIEQKGRQFTMEGTYKAPDDKINLKDATIKEGLSKLTETTVEFYTDDKTIKHLDFLGQEIRVVIEGKKDTKFKFCGYCSEIEEIGEYQGQRLFSAEVRPWLWFLTLERNNRIFQEINTIDIIKKVLEGHGFSGRLKVKATGTYEPRLYCVQYRESDYAFICRLMEEDGIYFFFQQNGDREDMVLADSISNHEKVPATGKDDKPAEFEYHFPDGGSSRDEEHIYDWNGSEKVTTGRVTLQDYNFEKPAEDLKKTKMPQSSQYPYNNREHYDYPGHYTVGSEGEDHANFRIEAMIAEHKTSRGVSNVRGMRAANTFKMLDHPVRDHNREYMVTEAVHYVGIDTDYDTEEQVNPLISRQKAKPEDLENLGLAYRCTFSVIPAGKDGVQYRAPRKTPWPEISSLHTAVVVGKSGEEIWTDEYGRIKVQFHWDRLGENDENSSCWVRVAMPWTGKDWGMFGIPRMGQEVVIQFEEGNPDRPICTGMMFNKLTMPPYAFPDNQTQTGIVTRSTKKGNDDTFHELVFEDKKGEEWIHFQSERDYRQIIRNNAEISIGEHHKDAGDLTQTIHNHKTEKLMEGNHTFRVEKGKQDIFIKTDHTEIIEGKSTQTITGNTKQTIKQGNEDVTLNQGNYTLKTSLGKVTIDAMQKIELKCGGSKIVLEPAKISISSPMIDIKADGMLNAKGNMTSVDGSAILKLTGGLIKIN